MSNVWQVVDARGCIGFVRATAAVLPDLPEGAELIDPHLAALEVPEWFPSEVPDRERVELLSEMCAAGAGMVSLDATRELDLLRERVAELLRARCILAFRSSPLRARDA